MLQLDHAHLLFPDSPVGTGHSYVDDDSLLCTEDRQIALDLVAMLTDVLTNHAPELADCPLYIVGESYAGKTSPLFALEAFKVIFISLFIVYDRRLTTRGWRNIIDGRCKLTLGCADQ